MYKPVKWDKFLNYFRALNDFSLCQTPDIKFKPSLWEALDCFQTSSESISFALKT